MVTRFSLTNLHLAVLTRCHLQSVNSILMIDVPSQEIADALMDCRFEWIASGSPWRIFYLYLEGQLISGFSCRETKVALLPVGAAAL
jgi:hypothetical protein